MLVSVIIPCYNVEAYVEECVTSVLNQTHKKIEIILVDNNSTDQTPGILNRLAEQYPDRIQAVAEKKKGAPAARNKGLSLAKGEWIQFLDADDLLEPKKITCQMSLVQPSTNFIVGKSIKRSVNGDEREMNPTAEPFYAVFRSNLGNTCANLWKKQELLKVGGWNESVTSSQEGFLMFELLKSNEEVVYDDGPAYTIVRERESGQISQSDPAPKWKNHIDLRVNMLRYFKTQMPEFFQKHKDQLFQTLFEQLRSYAQYDLDAASEVHKEFLKKFKPKESAAITARYLKMYNLLGFRKAEKLKKVI